MITVKKSKIKRKYRGEHGSDITDSFSKMSIGSKPEVEPIPHKIREMTDRWLIPIYTKTYCDLTGISTIPLQQTSIYSYCSRELIKISLYAGIDLKQLLFEHFGILLDEKHRIHQYDKFIFIHIDDPMSITKRPNYGWNNIFQMFQFRQPNREPYRDPYSAILYGYCIDNYGQWYKPRITTKIKLQNSSEEIALTMILDFCRKSV